MRERDSPNGNSYRSESPECDSPRDRGSSYHSKSLYVSKSRDKERENRDYKNRDKYSGINSFFVLVFCAMFIVNLMLYLFPSRDNEII